ncbi:MAG: septum formation initiator [Bacteroidia bacterium]|nr:MAG: septum formation initiator [Bacteroidia bacterium]
MNLRDLVGHRAVRLGLRLLTNRYVVILVVYGVWVTIFDANSLVDIRQASVRVEQLKQKKAYYEEKITRDSLRLVELKTSRHNLEKFAREQYYMRRENEDIYVVE